MHQSICNLNIPPRGASPQAFELFDFGRQILQQFQNNML